MPEIFTIGHSNHPIGYFLGLLARHGITALADVRTTPYSRFNPQFRREALAATLQDAGIAYVFLGQELGGKRSGVTHAEVAGSESFRRGLERLREGTARYRVAFMCAEREPLDCHRTILVARHLKTPDMAIHHILADGSIEEHESVERRLVEQAGETPPPLMAQDAAAWAAAVERAYEDRARVVLEKLMAGGGSGRGERPAAARAPRPWRGVVSLIVVGLVVLVAVVAAIGPGGPGAVLESRRIAAAVIFIGSYLALAIGRIPGLRIDRAGIALVGAGLMVASGALPLDEAYKAIDMDTITLLLGMMIIVASLRLSGFFALVNAWVVERARRPLVLLCAIAGTSGLFSAFLVNDAICLVLAPLVIELTLAMRRNPVPYLLAVAMASNVGSTATITGNPQNIMIGSFSHIPYVSFVAALAPVALVGLAVTVALIVVLHRDEFATAARLSAPEPDLRVNRALVLRSLLATIVVVGLFFAGVVPAKAAIIIGGLLLLTRRVKSRRIYREIDWSLLLMFAGLFIIVAGAERTLLTPGAVAAIGRLHLDQVPALTAVTAVLSNLVSNVPAVLMMKPFIDPLANHDTAWLTMAMASTLAGNLTVLGSIANLIVVQRAANSGVQIGLWDYCRVGIPLTLITLAIGALWLAR